jgi:hypothetical protein
MAFPDSAQMRTAIEQAIHNGLGLDLFGGDWFAQLEDGRDIQFRPAGEFEVLQCDEETNEERKYKFRVSVELVDVETV